MPDTASNPATPQLPHQAPLHTLHKLKQLLHSYFLKLYPEQNAEKLVQDTLDILELTPESKAIPTETLKNGIKKTCI